MTLWLSGVPRCCGYPVFVDTEISLGSLAKAPSVAAAVLSPCRRCGAVSVTLRCVVVVLLFQSVASLALSLSSLPWPPGCRRNPGPPLSSLVDSPSSTLTGPSSLVACGPLFYRCSLDPSLSLLHWLVSFSSLPLALPFPRWSLPPSSGERGREDRRAEDYVSQWTSIGFIIEVLNIRTSN